MQHQGLAATRQTASPGTLIPAWVDGRLTPVEKLAVHRAGLRHQAVSVFVMSGSRLLIQQRSQAKYHTPGLWANSCCTHPQWGEKPADCAVRRLQQELGITGLSVTPLGQVEYRADVGGGMLEHEVVDLFRTEASATLQTHPDPAEVMDLRWVTLPDLADEISHNPGRFTPWLRIYLADHAGVIFGDPAAT